jgi:hypothetical protein
VSEGYSGLGFSSKRLSNSLSSSDSVEEDFNGIGFLDCLKNLRMLEFGVRFFNNLFDYKYFCIGILCSFVASEWKQYTVYL